MRQIAFLTVLLISLNSSIFAAAKPELAVPAELHARGTLYFVPYGTQAIPIAALAAHYKEKFGIDVKTLPAAAPGALDYDAARNQLIAEEVLNTVERTYPQQANDPKAILVVITDDDLYPRDLGWNFTYSLHGDRFSVISTHRYTSDKLTNTLQSLTKVVALTYYGLPENNDPRSILHEIMTPWGGPDDIYQSDLHPESTPFGRPGYYACLQFTSGADRVLRPVNDFLGAGCGSPPDVAFSGESLQVRLEDGTFVERHVDAENVGIGQLNFRRAFNSGETRDGKFGPGTWHSFDSFLRTPDHMASLLWQQEDAGTIDFKRTVPGTGFRTDATYVDDSEPPEHFSGSQIYWKVSDFRLQLNDNSIYSFMPCDDSTLCYWDKYSTSNGVDFSFERDSNRVLQSIKGPDSEIKFDYDSSGHIVAIHIPDPPPRPISFWGKVVSWFRLLFEKIGLAHAPEKELKYAYDPAGELARVDYPDGSASLYAYSNGKMSSIQLIPSAGAPALTIAALEYDGLGRIISLCNDAKECYAFNYLPEARENKVVELIRPDSSHDVLVIGGDEDRYVWWANPPATFLQALSSSQPKS